MSNQVPLTGEHLGEKLPLSERVTKGALEAMMETILSVEKLKKIMLLTILKNKRRVKIIQRTHIQKFSKILKMQKLTFQNIFQSGKQFGQTKAKPWWRSCLMKGMFPLRMIQSHWTITVTRKIQRSFYCNTRGSRSLRSGVQRQRLRMKILAMLWSSIKKLTRICHTLWMIKK